MSDGGPADQKLRLPEHGAACRGRHCVVVLGIDRQGTKRSDEDRSGCRQDKIQWSRSVWYKQLVVLSGTGSKGQTERLGKSRGKLWPAGHHVTSVHK